MKKIESIPCIPKNKHLLQVLFFIAFAVSISFFCSCDRTNNKNYKIRVQSQSLKITEQKSGTVIYNSFKEIVPKRQTGVKPKILSNIVIPGRTIQSAGFSPEIENTINIDGAKLYIPAGAMKETGSLSVIGLLEDDLPPIPAEITNVTKNYTGFRFLPHGMHFNSAATIVMAYDETLIPEGYTCEDVYTLYFDETDYKWKALERDSIDHESKFIVSNTLHFTDMINGIIKIPESPETGGYAPTTIKDIKAADPSAGISFIDPPSANNEGETEISFPFNLPNGRSGMQPEIALQYSASGSSSWTGYGWGLSIPGISVDVSWGVPRYDLLKESETYLLGSTQLTPVAHRSEYVARIANRRFYSRIEGDFNKIIRYGDKPNNYWWEVTSKNGERSFYGGLPETGFDVNAVTFNTEGNIGYWALTQTRDVHGNVVNYRYDKPADCLQQLYISEITYTGFGSEPGPYKITFLRRDDTNDYVRKDTRINARLGFIQKDNALLRRLNITFKNDTIRSYTLQYKDGAFYKTLLESITELDASGKEFYTHRFGYYDDIQFEKGYKPYENLKDFNLESDHLADKIEDNIFGYFTNITALGSSVSWGITAGASATFGFDPNVAAKSTSLGGNGAYINSRATGIVSIIDLDGDGMPDKVFNENGLVYYRRNLGTDNTKLFGEKKYIKGINNISYSETSGSSGGAELNLPGFIFAGYNHTNLKTTVKEYFNDFNADGLVDFAVDGRVHYNFINAEGDPEFIESSINTPNPLHAKSYHLDALEPDSTRIQDSLIAQYPLLDAVRMWKAPYTGHININAPVHLIKDNSPDARKDTLKDGVKVSIQWKDSVLWSVSIAPDSFGIKTPNNVSNIPVSKNENIYFRVQSNFNGLYDQVHWDPEIVYLNILGDDSIPKIEDVNHKITGRFKSSEDFLLFGTQSVVIPDTGIIDIRTEFSKPFTTDSVTLEILRSDTTNVESILRTLVFGGEQVDTTLNYEDIPVLQDDYFKFRVKASTNIDWTKIKWNIRVEFTEKDSVTPSATFNNLPDYKLLYVNPILTNYPLVTDTAFYRKFYHDTTDTVRPIYLFPKLNNLTDSFVLSVKTKDSLIVKRKYPQFNTLANPEPFVAHINRDDTLFFEYHSYDIIYKQNPGLWVKFGDTITIADTSFIYNSTTLKNDTIITFRDTLIFIDSLQIKPSIYAPVKTTDLIFGNLYRGWGQFTYNSSDGRDTLAINESKLKISVDKNSKGNYQNTDSANLSTAINPLNEIFSMMVPYIKKGGYLGIDTSVYVTPEVISSSRNGQKNILVVKENFSNLDLIGYTKVIEDISNSGAGGANAPVANLSLSASWGNSTIIRDMMDMNGDGYPDLLTDNQIQYTGVLGGLINQTSSFDYKGHNSLSFADGLASGGNFVYAKNSNSAANPSTKATRAASNNNVKQSKNANSAEQTSKSTLGVVALPTFNLTKSNDSIYVTLMDINNDGLPDKVSRTGMVQLNLGYSFSDEEDWVFNNIRTGKTFDYALGGGGGLNYGNNSITAGISFSKSNNEARSALLDINGDNLPDLIKGYEYTALNPQGKLSSFNKSEIFFNTGAGFLGPIPWDTCFGAFDKGVSLGGSVNSGFTLGVAFFIFGYPFKFCVSPGGTYSQGLSNSTTQLSDINGDGMPDFLKSDNENILSANLSTLGRTNMLKTVYRPMGSNFTIDYLQTPATFRHPGGKWALASIMTFDGLAGDGIDSTLTTFEYEDGFYNRHERQFYGFATVKTHFHDTGNKNKIYRTVTQQYNNSDYYTKGKMLSETLSDGDGNLQTGTENTYYLRNIFTGEILRGNYENNDSSSAFVALEETKQYIYEGAPSPQITTKVTYSFDKIGNIIRSDYTTGNEKDSVAVFIEYQNKDSIYLHSVPSKLEIATKDGLMRKRETTINKLGDIIQVKQLISDGEYAQLDMEYDEYGNLTKVSRPANSKGERLWYTYSYDPEVHAYITRVSDAYGYSSSSAYNYKWGALIESTDMNGQKMHYTFDDCGRIQTITGPYEIAAGKPYTIAFEYHPEAVIPYAHTLHYDSVYNNLETYTFADGMSRPVQVKKSAALFSNANSDDTPGFIVSGKLIYDAFGRVTEAFQPVFEASSGNPVSYNSTPDIVNPTITSYDVLDRVLQVIQPDGSKTIHAYGIGNYNGENMLTDTLTDALDHKSIIFSNAKGYKKASIIKSAANDVITSSEFNALGEVISVTDPKGNKTISEYDKLGRRTSVDHPDAGLTKFTFDAAGNILSKVTANLKLQIPDSGAIYYHYDLERLVEIVYPRNVQNRVNYSYGDSGASHNRTGRIMLVQDASGGQEFFYGPLGEVIKTIRTVQMGESDMRTWIWSASYDTWNRIRTMSYPDGEKVTYTYNRAGNLNKMDGEKLGRNYAYISRIGYNKSEKQEYLQYGNGTVTTYFYEPERQRLKQMSLTADSKELMNNVYTYDALNNIRGITNNTASIGDIGGTISHMYNYDDLNRLTNASGIFTGKKDTSNYALDIKYDIMGDLLRKTQTHDTNREKQAATSYDFEYKYDGLKPNAVTKIGDRIFTYDENGNQTNWEDTATNDFRQLSWDEENRLTLVSDNGYLNRYIYDASGERVIKSHGGSQGVYINGAPAGIVNHSDNKYTIYVSPYFVLQNERFTKHYYAGSSRVISKIGNGQFENQYRLGVFEITAGKVNYIYRQQQILNDKKAFEEKAGIPPGPPTMKGIYADPLYSGIAYTDGGTPDTITPRGWPKKPIFAPAGGPPGAPIQWGTDITNDNADPGFGYVGTGNIEEDLRYFYHSDQLGSTNYITDAKGNIKQFIAYMPFGEILSEQHADWDSPYKFNAKERDTETGLYYYGARYYDPKASLWISTDPLAENYIGWNSYNYTFDNPVRYIDPDGMGPEDDLESGKSKKTQQPQKPLTFRNPIISAKQVDVEFIKSYKGDGKAQAPYEEGTSTKEFYTAAGESFIRVYTSGNTKPQGKWLTKYSVIRGLSPKEIQAKLALPNVPTHMVEVKPPANTLLRLGKTGPAFGQPGGGIQYEAIGKEFIPKSAFGNPTMLPKVAPVIAPIEKPLPITAPYGKRFQSYVKFFNQL